MPFRVLSITNINSSTIRQSEQLSFSRIMMYPILSFTLQHIKKKKEDRRESFFLLLFTSNGMEAGGAGGGH